MSEQLSPPLRLDAPPYRELTWAAVVFGVLIGAVMTAAFTYVALKLGFTLSGSTVAAILGFAVLRGVLRKGSIGAAAAGIRKVPETRPTKEFLE